MVYHYLKRHILFNSNGLAIWSGFPDITHVKKIMANLIGHFGRHDLVSVRILPYFKLIRAISEMDMWYTFWSDTYKNVKWIALTRKFADRKWPQVGLLNMIKLKFYMEYPYLKLHILFNSNGLAIWYGFPDITHITKIMAQNRPFWPPWPSFCPNLAQFRKRPSY